MNNTLKKIIRLISFIGMVISTILIIKDIINGELYGPFGIYACIIFIACILLIIVVYNTPNISSTNTELYNTFKRALCYIVTMLIAILMVFIIYCLWVEYFYNIKLFILWVIFIFIFLMI